MNSTLWQQLKTASLVTGEEPQPTECSQPWYVDVLLAISGWLSSAFLLAFAALSFSWLIDSPNASLIVGISLLSLAYWVLKRHTHSYVVHLALSVSLVGQLLILISLFADTQLENTSYWLIITVMEAILAAVMPNRLHAFFSAAAAVIGLDIVLNLVGLPYLTNSLALAFAAWLWLGEFHSKIDVPRHRAIAYGCSLAIIILSAINQFDSSTIFSWFDIDQPAAVVPNYILKITIVIPLLLIVFQLLKRYQAPPLRQTSMVIYSATILIALISIPAYGIASALALLTLGWSASNRLLTTIGIAALLLFICGYYYQLEFTLLEKSITLFGMAMMALSIRWLLQRLWPTCSSSVETDNG